MLYIVQRKNSFSERICEYLKSENVDYVSLTERDVFDRKYRKGDFLFWHVSHVNKVLLSRARSLFRSLVDDGVKTYPSLEQLSIFEDKYAQAALFQSLSLNIPKTFISEDVYKSLHVCFRSALPVVVKLSGGAGSSNVHLVKSRLYLMFYVLKRFSIGHNAMTLRPKDLKQEWIRRKRSLNILSLFRYIKRIVLAKRDRGYLLMQEYIASDYDIRVVKIGTKYFIVKRWNRPNDFRASGSGHASYEFQEMYLNLIESFHNFDLGFGDGAYDFIWDDSKGYLLVEYCYGYNVVFYDKCEWYIEDMVIVNNEYSLQVHLIKHLLSQ